MADRRSTTLAHRHPLRPTSAADHGRLASASAAARVSQLLSQYLYPLTWPIDDGRSTTADRRFRPSHRPRCRQPELTRHDHGRLASASATAMVPQLLVQHLYPLTKADR